MIEVNEKITNASLILTRSCNLACDYCFTHGCTAGDMPWEVAQRAVDFLFNNAKDSKLRSVEISFWGGEPLLKWELLKQIVIYAKRVSNETAIPVTFGGTTNGVLLTKDKFDFLDEHKVLFMVSFDGTPETHNTYRKFKSGLGSHDIIVKNLKDALQRWPQYRVRMSPFADRIDHFFDDIKYIFDLGCNYIMFSPVYESNFTDEHWKIWEEQCYKVVDYMKVLRDAGRPVEIEHFKSYIKSDNSNRACGAGVFYANIDIDGAIDVCHRFLKYDDPRPWTERPYCIGHIDYGITRPDIKAKFENPDHSACGDCPRLGDTPCHSGCTAVNYDFTGNPFTPYQGICNYVNMQKRVSQYYYKILGCTASELNNVSCFCHMAQYMGFEGREELEQKLNILAMLVRDLHSRVLSLEGK